MTHGSTAPAASPRRRWVGPGPGTHLDTCRWALRSDRAVAEILGVSPSQVSRWRSGQLPDPENADRLVGLALTVEMLGRWLAPGS